jgi:hypothetical protein
VVSAERNDASGRQLTGARATIADSGLAIEYCCSGSISAWLIGSD